MDSITFYCHTGFNVWVCSEAGILGLSYVAKRYAKA